MLIKSSINPAKDKGNKNKKLIWSKIELVMKLVRINVNPPPLGLIFLWELLWLGISGIIFLKGLIKKMVNNQLNSVLKIRIKEIFKIWFI